MENEDKLTVFKILRNTGFFSLRHTKELNSARMKDALYILPKAIDKIRNPLLPTIENVEDSSDLEGQGVKIIIPSKKIVSYSRLEFFLGLELSGHTDTLTEASNLIDGFYNRGETRNEQQYRNALNKFST